MTYDLSKSSLENGVSEILLWGVSIDSKMFEMKIRWQVRCSKLLQRHQSKGFEAGRACGLLAPADGKWARGRKCWFRQQEWGGVSEVSEEEPGA